MSVRNLNIIADQVHPFMSPIFRAEYGISQQDNAPRHTSQIIRKRLEENSREFQVMFLLPNSSHLNPVEHLWFHLKILICVATVPPHNVRELQDQLVNTWYQILHTAYTNFMELIPR